MTDFSSIINAVKPRERSTHLYILAALWTLGATTKPTTSTEIAEVLALHLGGKAPSNVPAKLRLYSADVRVTEKGPPLRWLLTERGTAKLREKTGLPLLLESAAEGFGVDVGIVCALEHPEFSAMMAAAGGASNWKEVGSARYPHVYRQIEVVDTSGKSLTVVGTTSTSMGLTAAAIVTTQLIMQFRPRIVVMTGIAAGTRDGGKQFGDVLVADPSVDYNSGKVIRQNGVRGFQPDPYPIGLNPRLRSVLHKYRGQHPIFAEIRKSWTGSVPAGSNRLHVGPLGAADQVIDDAARIVEVQGNWRKLIGVEMETYGVYRACHEAPDPKPRFVSFKSVCDFAAEKSDSWQEYAAYVAAEFALRFLRAEWSALWPKG